MLILKRKKNDSILIGNDIRITVLDCDNGSVSLAICPEAYFYFAGRIDRSRTQQPGCLII